MRLRILCRAAIFILAFAVVSKSHGQDHLQFSEPVKHPQRNVSRIAIAPGATRVATAGEQGIDVWRPTDGQTIFELHAHNVRPDLFCGDRRAVNDLVFSPSGQELVTAGDDGNIIVWSAEDGRRLGVLAIAVLRSTHGGEPRGQFDLARVGVGAIAVSRRQEIAAAMLGQIVVWNFKTAKIVRRFGSTPRIAALAPATLAQLEQSTAKASDEQVRAWLSWKGDQPTPKLSECELWKAGRESHNIERLAFSDDERLLAASTGAGVDIYDYSKGECCFRVSDANFLAFAAGGTQAITSHRGEGLRIWNCQTGEELRRLAINGRVLSSGPGRESVLVARADILTLFDGATAKPLWTFPGRTVGGRVAAVASDRHAKLIVASWDAWNTKSVFAWSVKEE